VALPTAIYDACVLYPAALRDLLMHLALADLFHARWTDTIHEEWMRGVLRDRPDLTAEQLGRTRMLMDKSVRDCLVVDYEHLIPNLCLPDPDDRHVLAAAIHAHAKVIVTFNLDDFPAAILRDYDIEAMHPDEFIAGLFDMARPAVLAAVKRQRQGLKKPPMTASELLGVLERSLPQTVACLREFAELI
jgi:predicted nucleic acid-binding protein